MWKNEKANDWRINEKCIIDTLIAIDILNVDNLDGETIARITMICDSTRYPIETILSELNKEIQTHLF